MVPTEPTPTHDPEEIMYSNFHFWFQRSTGKIGVSQFGFQSRNDHPNLLDYKKGEVTLGTIVDRLLFVMRIPHPDGDLIVQNPVSGAIIEYNPHFSFNKELESADNWIYRVIATDAEDEMKYLFTKEQYQRYYRLGNIGRGNLTPVK